MPHGFMGVNTKSGAGKAFLRSLYEQYAEWGVDFGNVNFSYNIASCYIPQNNTNDRIRFYLGLS